MARESRPKSIAVIPDGNRRYAKKHGLPLEVAYAKGFQKVNSVLEWAFEEKVRRMSFWALSFENFKKRSSLELRVLFGLMREKMNEALHAPEFKERDVRIKFFGRVDLLPKTIQELVKEIEEKTGERSEFELQVGIAYSGQEEIIRASTMIAQELAAGRVSEEQLQRMPANNFYKYLYTSFEPDMVIRTGGVHRLSGFLPFQSAYSEYYFSPKLWPEFSKKDFQKSVWEYENAQRRFGK